MTSSLVLLLVSGLLVGAITAPPSQAAVIDLFTGEPESIQRVMGTEAPRRDSPYLLESSLFEIRELRLRFGEVTQSILIENGTLSYSMGTTITIPRGNNLGYFNLQYLSLTPVDLLGNGATAFRIKFNFFSSSEVNRLQFFIRSQNSSDTSFAYLSNFHIGSAVPTELTIPFSAFPDIDFTQVEALGINGGRMALGTTFVIASVTTVPEPNIPILLFGFAATLLFRRGRLRRCHQSMGLDLDTQTM